MVFCFRRPLSFLPFWISLALGIGLVTGCQGSGGLILDPSARAAGDQPVLPSGDFSPGSQSTWAFNPPKDTYDRRSLLDLRSLNEAIAGETGFIRLSGDGEGFVRGDGREIRFWEVNINPRRLKYEEIQDQARFLAKRGVNLVRLHESLPLTKDGDFHAIDPTVRERIWQTVAAMKKEGIYVTVSPYWGPHLKPPAHWPVPQGSRSLAGLLFFDPQLQKAYEQWWQALLEPVNPYTGIALKNEPAIALWHLQNEDSLLFWTVQGIQGEDLARLEKQYGVWLTEKYGDLEQIPWVKQATLPADNPATKRLGLYPIYALTQKANPQLPRGQRLADQTEFFTQTQRQFNQKMGDFLQKTLGAKQLINANNWRTASTPHLNDAERYSYTSNAVIGVNRYYTGGGHQGEKAGWAIRNGDKFGDRSVLFDPWAFPLAVKPVAGYPFIISESSWVSPLGYQSEGPLLVSAYRSLLGIDGFYWFSMAEPQWRQPSSANGFLPSIGKWVINTPELLGNFPAAALLYRKNYVQTGSTVIQETRPLTDLWQRQPALIQEEAGFDPNRDTQPETRPQTQKEQINPLAFLVGPVRVRYGLTPSPNQVKDLRPFFNRSPKQIQAVTQEMQWDYGRGQFVLNAPKAQGITGFFPTPQSIPLRDGAIAVRNAYVTVMMVALDDLPLKDSRRVLVQVGTLARPTHWQQRPTQWQDKQKRLQKGWEVVNYGQAPWRIVKADLTITLNNPHLKTAKALDMNGLPQQTLPIDRRSSSLQFTFPPQGKYVLLTP